MRTMVVVGLVVGPVLVLGAPMALASGVAPPPDWTARGAFAVAAAAAFGGIVLVALSFRRRGPAAPGVPAPAPAAPVAPTAPVAPAVMPPRVGSRYVARPAVAPPADPTTVDPASADPVTIEPDTGPVPRSRERYVTLRTRRHPQAVRRTTVPVAVSRSATREGVRAG